MTNRVMTVPKSAHVMQEGLRASDSMNMTLSAEHAVEQGDDIFYIQDVADVTNLKAIWNFYGGFRDESGYEHDDVYTAPHIMPNCVDSALVGGLSGGGSDLSYDWKHKGYYKFKIEAHNNSSAAELLLNGVEVEKKFKNNDTNTATKVPVIDMSGDFDMIFEFKTTWNRDGQTLFDNYDHATSGGRGLKVVINSASTNITITADDGTTETIMVASGITSYNTVTFVRIRRQGGVFKLYLDGVEKALTFSTNAGNLNSNQNIHFFKEYDESTSPAAYVSGSGWTGVPIQFRFYNITLSDIEVKKIRVSKPVNTTMKFGGKIWKIEDKGNTKQLSCSSFAKELLGTQISASTFINQPNAASTDTVGDGERIFNRYYDGGSGRANFEAIIQDILKYIDDGVYTYFADEPNTSCQGDFIAEGSFLDILKVMMIIDSTDHMFVVTPRKILFISDEVLTNQVISNQNYDIVDSGKDDTGTTNSLYVTGRKKAYSHKNTYTNLAITVNTWGTPQTIQSQNYFTPVVERVVRVMRDLTEDTSTTPSTWSGGDEIFGDAASYNQYLGTNPSKDTYRLLDNNTIQFYNKTGGTVTYELIFEYSYDYDSTATYSLSTSTTQHREDSASIELNGLYHRNFNVPQIVSGFDVTTFCNRYLIDFKTVNTRQRAITASLVNSLTVGQKVRYTTYDKKTNTWSTDEKTVRSIEYSYPQTVTVIELGEYMFSGFDVEKETIDSVRSLDTSVSVSRY